MFGLFHADDKIDAGELGLGEEPVVSPAGVYQVRVRVIEGKDFSAINSFSLYQSLVSSHGRRTWSPPTGYPTPSPR